MYVTGSTLNVNRFHTRAKADALDKVNCGDNCSVKVPFFCERGKCRLLSGAPKPNRVCCFKTARSSCNIYGVVIKNIPINADDIVVQGKNQDTWCTMICDDAIKLIKFKCPDDDIFLNAEGDYVTNIIGKLGYNYYNGVKTAQIIVNDYEVI